MDEGGTDSMTDKSYKNPPIHEALVEFRFNMPDGESDLLLPGKVHTLLAETYSAEPKRIQTVETTVSAGEQGSNLSLMQGPERIQFPNGDNTKSIILGRNSLSINCQRKYDGWDEEFKARIEKALSAYMSVTKHKVVTRIGLRYINTFQIKSSEAPSDYLEDASKYNTLEKWSLMSFFDRSERRCDSGEKLLVTMLSQPAGEKVELVLDIDAIAEAIEIADLAEVMKKVEELHAIEKTIFEKSITRKARDLFDA